MSRLAMNEVFQFDGPATLTVARDVSKTGGHTESFNRVLVIWLALQDAMALVRQEEREHRESPLTPWDCNNQEVRRLWDELTHPKNLAALWEWLYQSASGEQEVWALQAYQECRVRSEEDDSG
jgi:hypothetical protein